MSQTQVHVQAQQYLRSQVVAQQLKKSIDSSISLSKLFVLSFPSYIYYFVFSRRYLDSYFRV